MHKSLFKNLKVVELASVLAGPSVGLFFAEMGAEVIKVENPKGGGDVTRGWRLPVETKESTSAYYASVNSGKKVVFKDLSMPAELNDVYRLLDDADVVVVNFKWGDALKFGLDYARVKAINPTIIYGEITGFTSDPKRAAYDVVIQAETGWMSINGEKDSEPLKMPLAFMDVLAGHQLKEGILAALWQRERSSKGARVICSLEDAGIAALVNQASNYLHAGHIPIAMGSLHPNIAPYGDVFDCRDGRQIVLAVGSDKQFSRLMHILSKPEYAQDKRFATNQERVVHRASLQNVLAPLFKLTDRDSLMGEFISQNVPAGSVKTIDEVFESKAGKNMIKEDSGLHSKSAFGNAFTMSKE